MMANHPRLPLELIEQIIDKVARPLDYDPFRYQRPDFPSLKICALVCHSFLDLCRKHIFGSVSLSKSPSSDDLNHLLSNSPHLAVYIRELGYFVNQKEFDRERLPWLSSMFKKLVKLQKLIIGHRNSQRRTRVDWTSSFMRKALLPLLHLPTLTSITFLATKNFTPADLAGCGSLKKLRIEYSECSTSRAGKFLQTLPASPPMLEELMLTDDNVVQRLCHVRRPDGKPIIDFSSLKKLQASVGQLDLWSEFFGMCRNLHQISLSCMSLSRISSLHPFDVFSS